MSQRALGSAVAAVACASGLLLACSLAVSTSGLSGGTETPGEAGEASAQAADATTDVASGEGGPDAARNPSLVSGLSFEDPVGSTTARDTSGFERHGLVKGGATFVTDGVRGHVLAVSGTGFVVVDALGGKAFPRTGTLSVWFRYATPAGADIQRSIFDLYDPDRSHIFVRHANGAPEDEIQLALQPVGGLYVAVAKVKVPADTWTHFVMTWDETKSEAALYSNGVLVDRGAYTAPFAPVDQLFRMGEGLVGAIDQVRLYNRALPDAEAVQLD